jgi:hypothetical protein
MYYSLTGCGGSFTRMRKLRRKKQPPPVRSLRVGMSLTFRAEVMPGRDRLERTFQVTKVLANGRIELAELEGQHSLAEFERTC